MTTINPNAEALLKEPCFELFKHEGFFCLIQRIMYRGHLCGYVAVPETHSLYGKDYSDKVVVPNLEEVKFNGNYLGLLCVDVAEAQANIVELSMALDVHCGITFTHGGIGGITDNVLGKLWWFGFDTAHSGDATPFLNEIDRKYQFNHEEDAYRNFEFVKEQAKSLAEQLAKF